MLKNGLLGLTGHLRVTRANGEVIVDQKNLVVTAGINALVDALQAQAYINTWKYVGFGLGTTASAAGDTELETEISGGTYARLSGTQGEGANAQTYRVSGTWTNTSGASRVVTEYGLFSAASDGTMLCRVSTGDASPPASKTVAENETITVQWDLALADA